VVVFQSVFCTEMHQTDFFYFLKIIFEISVSKRSKSYKKKLFLAKKIKILIERGLHRVPKLPMTLILNIIIY